MNAKEILDPRKLMIAVGAMVVIMSLMGMANGEEWAAVGWGGEENVLAHDAAYEEMWALHLMPLGVMAIATGLFVTGKELAKMSMMAPLVIVIIMGGMGAITGDSGYGAEIPPMDMFAPALITVLLTVTLGISGYLHKDGE
tara:strand:+ start:164 stop:586 length:423 start_codon:yes stop_codon:yes gene_type:complete